MEIAVLSEFKRHCIGSAIEEWAKAIGVKVIRSSSGDCRTGAHEFYRKMGYGDEKMQINFRRFW